MAQHKGYATRDHLEALRRHGPTPLHRYSFAPVRDARCWSVGATQIALLPEGTYPESEEAEGMSPPVLPV